MDKDSYWARIDEPLEYHVGGLWKLACIVLGLFFGFGGRLFTSGASFERAPIDGFVMAGVCIFISIFCLLYAFRGLIRITSNRIDYRWAFATNSMMRDEVVGKKLGHTSNGREFYRLVSNSGRLMLLDGGTFNVDDRFFTWLESLPTIEKKRPTERYKGF